MIREVVNNAQSGFIPGKHISDNILLATKLIKGYSHRYISPRCMIKIDIKKAYESLEQSFLETVMIEMGFPAQFMAWVMGCVTSVSYSILVNGQPTMPFGAKKGLRQGDPMSLSSLPWVWSICQGALMSFLKMLSSIIILDVKRSHSLT